MRYPVNFKNLRFPWKRGADAQQIFQSASQDPRARVAIAYVGCIVPDEARFHNAAFSRAGQMYQQELLLGLKRTGLAPSLILSVVPMPAYPKVRRIWVRGGEAYLPEKLPLTLLSFLNITPLKQISIGIGVLFYLLSWGWRTRQATSRVVYTYNLSVPPGLFTLLGARLIRAKAVASLCDINVPGATVSSSWVWRFDYWLQRKLIPHFDGRVVASDAIARDFSPGSPYLRLEGGVREEVFARTEDAPAIKIANGKPFVIAAAGRLDETNGFLILLKAFSFLKGNLYRLHIAGGGPLECYVREAAAMDTRITYLGMISFSDVLQLYKHSDVLVNMRATKNLHTRYFFPSKMMEFLASGTPVITTCTGHVEEEFGSFVHLLHEETPEGLADMIRYVAGLDEHVRKAMGQKARSYMATHKTWDAQSRRLAKYIREIVLRVDSGTVEGQAASPFAHA